jgi:hypothetical protein
MLPPRLVFAAVNHHEVIKHVRERQACNRHAQLVSMGEVGPAFVKSGPCIPARASGGR